MQGELVLYTAAADAPQWMERRLMPSGAFTQILSQQVWHSGDDPALLVGTRLKTFNGSPEAPEPTTKWTPSDWLVSSVERYEGQGQGAEYAAISICHCTYLPVEPNWQEVVRLESVLL